MWAVYWFLEKVLPLYQRPFDRMAKNVTENPVVYGFRYFGAFVLFGILIPITIDPIIPLWITFPVLCVLVAPLQYLIFIEYWSRFFKNFRR